jgi:hypothetical protein
MSQASERRLRALRASGAATHSDTELARIARAAAPVAAPAPTVTRVRRASTGRARLGSRWQPCGVAGCVNGCHDCE